MSLHRPMHLQRPPVQESGTIKECTDAAKTHADILHI